MSSTNDDTRATEAELTVADLDAIECRVASDAPLWRIELRALVALAREALAGRERLRLSEAVCEAAASERYLIIAAGAARTDDALAAWSAARGTDATKKEAT